MVGGLGRLVKTETGERTQEGKGRRPLLNEFIGGGPGQGSMVANSRKGLATLS